VRIKFEKISCSSNARQVGIALPRAPPWVPWFLRTARYFLNQKIVVNVRMVQKK
jgi:hypothetical protein